MNYEESAAELLDCRMNGYRKCRVIQNNIAEAERGELPVLLYLIEGGDGAGAGELRTEFKVNSSRVASILNSLCKKGYVERVPDLGDRRRVRVFVTDEGRHFATARREETISNLTELLRLLGEEDALEYVRIMKRVAEISEQIAGQDGERNIS